ENLRRPDRQEFAAEMTGCDAVDHVCHDAEEQQPHGCEVPEQRASKPDVIVHALGAIPRAEADRCPGRKGEMLEQRLLVVDLPAAPDQDDDAKRPAPMCVTDEA